MIKLLTFNDVNSFFGLNSDRQFILLEEMSRARPEAGLEAQSKALGRGGGRGLVFISTEPVYMDNKLPAWGGRPFFITATRRNEKMTALFSKALWLYRVFEGAREEKEYAFVSS